MLCREVSQNAVMPTPNEKIAFSKRLELALRRCPEKEKVKGPSDLAVQFSLRYEGKGVSPQRLVAAGFGEYQPIEPEKSDEAYTRNRRIELKLTER